MSSIRLYLDEDTSNLALISALRASNVDVVTVLEAGKLGCSDEELKNPFVPQSSLPFLIPRFMSLSRSTPGRYLQALTKSLLVSLS